jgi:hypothetical protein
MAAKKNKTEKTATAPVPAPQVGYCRPVFKDEREVRTFFESFRESVAEDLHDLAAARRRSEEVVMRGFATH